ncbi:esterase-like activity of phytase family protein [Thiomicrorhabdus indica]|uniref:esterase-like activity of phytase family protein n=1 Tax=Thiomicrorhabdus indica TaxID=2267253 RepID=UPI002AA6F834|nr:esterase-like activity of phytase family protein [Thiomicrorhabdus indica]
MKHLFKIKTLSLAMSLSIGSFALTGCNSDNNNTSTTPSIAPEGVYLPYNVLRSDLIDGKTQQTFEVRNGGYGSAATAHPTNANQFYALTDRGPNATFTGDYGKGKKFPTPNYTPRVGLFEVSDNGTVSLVKEILLKRPDGSNITGLPNTSALGGTGETPYNADGSPVLVDPTQPYDETLNPIKLDDYGLDGEGLVALSDGTFWVSDEYGPHIVHFDADGKEIGRINAFNDSRNTFQLPAEFGNRRANRGMEGLAITPDEKTLVGIIQSTMYNPSSAVKDLDITRIVTINLDDGTVGQYLYKQDKTQNSNSEIVALSNTEFLVLERDGAFLYGGPNGAEAANPEAQKKVFRIDISNATNLETFNADNFTQDANLGLMKDGQTLEELVLNSGWDALTDAGITAAPKEEVLDMVAKVDYPHDKMEGLWLIDDSTLGVINDDDFATWSTGGELEQKMLTDSEIDGNRLYIVNDLDLAPRN